MDTKLIDELYHLGPYLWKGKSIGGKIKERPSDFKVIELDNNIPIDPVEILMIQLPI